MRSRVRGDGSAAGGGSVSIGEAPLLLCVARTGACVRRVRAGGVAECDCVCSGFEMQTTPGTVWSRGLSGMCVRRCPTLPHPVECSTIGAGGLSFRVRNGTGRFPSAMAAVTLRNSVTSEPATHMCGLRIRVFGCVTEQLVCCFRYCTVDA